MRESLIKLSLMKNDLENIDISYMIMVYKININVIDVEATKYSMAFYTQISACLCISLYAFWSKLGISNCSYTSTDLFQSNSTFGYYERNQYSFYSISI